MGADGNLLDAFGWVPVVDCLVPHLVEKIVAEKIIVIIVGGSCASLVCCVIGEI